MYDRQESVDRLNVIAHGYFDIDAEQVFNICKKDILELIRTVRVMIKDLQDGTPS